MVTKQEQLEWLAKAYKTWPEQGVTSLRLSAFEVGKFAIVNAHTITKQEWMDERNKTKNLQNNIKMDTCAVNAPMTLDEAIEHAKDKAKELQGSCADNHKQLADWLQDYKNIKEHNNVEEAEANFPEWFENKEYPPIGEEVLVEYDTLHEEYYAARIIGYEFRDCVFRWLDGPKCGDIVSYDNADAFQPLKINIKTEREKILEDIVNILSDIKPLSFKNMATVLFEAGYRKD